MESAGTVRDRNKAVVHRLIEEFLITGDPDVADEVLAPNYVDRTPSNPGLTGLENLKRFVNEWLSAFPVTRNVIDDILAEGDSVAVRWTVSATHRGRFRRASPLRRSRRGRSHRHLPPIRWQGGGELGQVRRAGPVAIALR